MKYYYSGTRCGGGGGYIYTAVVKLIFETDYNVYYQSLSGPEGNVCNLANLLYMYICIYMYTCIYVFLLYHGVRYTYIYT